MKQLVLFIGVLAMTMSSGGNSAVAQGNVSANESGLAISGYDAVAYFTSNEAIRGNSNNVSTFDGAKFYFSSEENKKQFDANPAAYAPQYGGHCAFAMAVGNGKVPSNPETFKLYNGKLYLFFNDYYQGSPFNTIVPWNGDEASLKHKADANWRELTSK